MILGLHSFWYRLRASFAARRDSRRQADQEADRDAADLIRRHGDLAYYLARQMAREQRKNAVYDDIFPHSHWDRVRRRIAAMTGREITADGVRYVRSSSKATRC